MKNERRGPAEPTVEILERRVGYEGFFRLEQYRLRHRLFNGQMSGPVTRELFERGHAAAVLPYDPVRDEVVLLEQFRIGALDAVGGPWLIEIVAGIIEEGETPGAVIQRESFEEAGCHLSRVERICEYLVSPGGTSESISLFCGQVRSKGVGGVHGLADEDEDIRVMAVSFKQAWDWMCRGRINSASPIIALQWLALNRRRLRREWTAG